MNWFKFAYGGRRITATLALVAGLGATAVAVAQTGDDGTDAPSVQTGLDLPPTMQIFGKLDPNVRKPTAIVNRAVITGTDVDQRVALIVALNKIKLTDELRNQIRMQVLRSLIDETLEIQEAASKDIKVTKEELTQGYAHVASNFKMTPEKFTAFLKEIGSSPASLMRQVEAQLAWQRLLSRQVAPFINVGDDEVKAVIDRLKAAKGTEEFHLKEIYLSAPPGQEAQTAENMKQIMEQLKKGVPFGYLASHYSEATTRASEGDLGWVRLNVLPAQLAQAAQQMQVGQVAGPIQIPGGFSLLYLADKRQLLTANAGDARLSLRQITVNFPPGLTKPQATELTAKFAQATKEIKGCGNANAVAKEFNGEVVDNDSIVARTLPPALQDILLKLQIGQATPPFGSITEGVRVLVLCGRDDPKDTAIPSIDQVRNNMEQQRISLRADRMLRDLRRDAVIEYK